EEAYTCSWASPGSSASSGLPWRRTTATPGPRSRWAHPEVAGGPAGARLGCCYPPVEPERRKATGRTTAVPVINEVGVVALGVMLTAARVRPDPFGWS